MFRRWLAGWWRWNVLEHWYAVHWAVGCRVHAARMWWRYRFPPPCPHETKEERSTRPGSHPSLLHYWACAKCGQALGEIGFYPCDPDDYGTQGCGMVRP